MRDWFSLNELVEIGAFVAPRTRKDWLKIALREGWRARRKSNGEPLCRMRKEISCEVLEYHIWLLPFEAQIAVVARDAFDAAEREGFRCVRRALTECADRLRSVSGASLTTCIHYISLYYENRRFPIPDWALADCQKVSPSTLFRWRTVIWNEDCDAYERLESVWFKASPTIRERFLSWVQREAA